MRGPFQGQPSGLAVQQVMTQPHSSASWLAWSDGTTMLGLPPASTHPCGHGTAHLPCSSACLLRGQVPLHPVHTMTSLSQPSRMILAVSLVMSVTGCLHTTHASPFLTHPLQKTSPHLATTGSSKGSRHALHLSGSGTP